MTKKPLAIAIAAVVLTFAAVGGASAQTQLYTSPTASPTPNTIDNGVTPAVGSSTTAPGAPNTGAGGDTATNIALLLASGIVAVGGLTYLARSLKTS